MSFIQNFFSSRDNNANTEAYVGQKDRLWYNPDTNTIRISDGNTPGGLPIDLAIDANLTINTFTANSGNIIGDLIVGGNISPATDTKIGGVKAGPGANISNDGTLTIDTAGLPLSFGDFTANNNLLTLVNVDQNMILATKGNAEVQLVGNIGFYKTNGFPPNLVNRYFSATDDGQITVFVPNVDPTAGAVRIIGSTSGQVSPPVNTGVMLHLTGQNDIPSRFYNDGIGNFAAFVGRRINGNIVAPTPVQAGDEIIRISSTGYNGTEVAGTGSARIVFQAIENFTPTNTGSNLSFWAAAIGSNTLTKIATVDVANGFNATKFTTDGTITASGNANVGNIGANNAVFSNISVTGNISGNVSGTTLTANLITGTLTTNAQPNVTSVGTLTSLSVSGNINAGNVNSYVTLPAGNATVAPLVFTPATTLLTTPSPGAVNYDGRIFYATPQGQERGLLKTAQIYVLNADHNLIDQTAGQSLFGVTAAVSSNTRYAYSINVIVYKTANNITMAYAVQGTSVLARHSYQTITTAATALATLSTPSHLKNILTTGFSTPVTVTAALNGAGYYTLTVTGIINVTTGGTFNPLIAFSGLPGAGSYVAVASSIELYPIGVGNATVSIGNWT